MFKHNAYFIETLTNTHVGTGDSDNGMIDNMIQKDSRTKFPIIYPSSLKGAIKDHFKLYLSTSNKQQKASKLMKPFTFQAIFGEEEPGNLFKKSFETLTTSLIKVALGEKSDKSLIDEINTFKQKHDTNSSELKQRMYLYSRAPKQGLIKFFEGRLLTIPLGSTKRVFYHTTCPHAAIDYLKNLLRFNCVEKSEDIESLINFFNYLQYKLYNSKKDFIVFSKDSPNTQQDIIIDDFENGICFTESQEQQEDNFEYKKIKKLIPHYFSADNAPDYINSFAVFHDDYFRDICKSRLPVIARNHLSDTGESTNLFYEEVLPGRSLLWFMTGEYQFKEDVNQPKYDKEREYFIKGFKFFEQKLVTDTIQMGANKSIGYGVTSITKIAKGGSSEQVEN
ncbi:CRISPR-associated RAMP protein, Cmr4 family [Candidatus Magnetomorum sp. HK-1]|nr:CRISPR-associated RAMP protein, Cmr4 family [Candidatus Magnetomorum sp. HK-1]